MRIADCEPMQIVYFFGMVDFTGSGLRSAEVETVGGGGGGGGVTYFLARKKGGS